MTQCGECGKSFKISKEDSSEDVIVRVPDCKCRKEKISVKERIC